MLSYLSKRKKRILLAFLIALCLPIAAALANKLHTLTLSEDCRFRQFTDSIFRSEISGNTLNLHYTLAYPEKQGIPMEKITLGTVGTDIKKEADACQKYEQTLKSFRASKLSTENQITLDTLLLYFHTQAALPDIWLLEEPLGPSLGIQAQLPVLLAEYAFYRDTDITDYLHLLSAIRPYFESILTFEQKKSQAGYFMSDATLHAILKQCQAFIQDPDSNYMLEVFRQKLNRYGKLSEEEQQKLCEVHHRLLVTQVIPAYKYLMTGLMQLRGTGRNDQGLASFDKGKAYYRYLLKSQDGIYDSVPTLTKQLSDRLKKDTTEIRTLIRKDPAALSALTGGKDLPDMKPSDMLGDLKQRMQEDFPPLKKIACKLSRVHKSMEPYLSPAFYLTPPLDTEAPNVIYINQARQNSNLELYTTLSHEGFPGHLYQTVTFGRLNPAPIRSIIGCGGYVEGWATYVESYGYQYAAALLDDEHAANFTRLAWLNRDLTLCLYSILDLGIHYRGWSPAQAAQFLNTFGIRDASTASRIYRYIVETPANYLKYYAGAMNFFRLRDTCEQKMGADFDLKQFHENILKIGPVPFPILKKYL